MMRPPAPNYDELRTLLDAVSSDTCTDEQLTEILGLLSGDDEVAHWFAENLVDERIIAGYFEADADDSFVDEAVSVAAPRDDDADVVASTMRRIVERQGGKAARVASSRLATTCLLPPVVSRPVANARTVTALLGVAAALMIAASLVFYSMPEARQQRNVVFAPGRVPVGEREPRPPAPREDAPEPEDPDRVVSTAAKRAAPTPEPDVARITRPTRDRADPPGEPTDRVAARVEAPPAPGKPGLAAYVVDMTGDVEVRTYGVATWRPAYRGVPVYAGDGLRTKFARARVRFDSGTVFYVNRFTTLALDGFERPENATGTGLVPRISVVGGGIVAEVVPADHGFTVGTPEGRVVDLGTKFGVRVKGKVGTTVTVATGRVKAGNKKGLSVLEADEELNVSSVNVAPGPVRRVDAAKALAWTDEVPGSPAFALRKGLLRGLVGYWSFDEGHGTKALDSASRTYHGMLRGPRRVPGVMGPALRFDGDDAVVVEQPKRLVESPGELTVAAWVCLDKPGDDMKIAITIDDVTGGGFSLDVFRERARLVLRGEENRGVVTEAPGAGRKLRPGRWYHIAGTYSAQAGCVRTYVDGQLDAACNALSNATAGGGQMLFGAHPKQLWGMVGRIDEVAVFVRALAPEEIQLLAARRGLR